MKVKIDEQNYFTHFILIKKKINTQSYQQLSS